MRCPVTNELIQKLNTYEEFTQNFLAVSTRKETIGGIEYLVAPASMLVPGVLNGSQGPLYYPETEVTKNVQAWNMMPLTLGHPTEEGRAVSARVPKVLEKFGLGFVFNATTAKGTLVAEAWFDVARTKVLAPSIISNIESGKPIELSTGLFTENFPVKNKSYNGRPYDAVARNYRPDHLAILIDATGACSIADGCGVSVTNQDKSCTLKQPCSLSRA